MKTATFTIGLPAAGKSTITAQMYPDTLILDCDKIKASHPDYDPKNPAPLHDWSKAVLAGQFETALAGDVDFILDSTGTDPQKLAGDMLAARLAGFQIAIVYVTVPLSVSLERNARRERNVPEHIIREKAATVAASFETVRATADSVTVIDNSKDNRS